MESNLNSGQRYLTVDQAANYMGVSKWTVYRLVEGRQIPFISLSPSSPLRATARKAMIRLDARNIDRWMERQTISAVE
jgi:predicted DNA-binding transcriptional regulator AlpA